MTPGLSFAKSLTDEVDALLTGITTLSLKWLVRDSPCLNVDIALMGAEPPKLSAKEGKLSSNIFEGRDSHAT